MIPAVMSMAEVAVILKRSPRASLRWLQSRLGEEPEVLIRAAGERVWSVRRDAFLRLTGADESDLRTDVEKVVRDVKDLDRRVRYLEADVTAAPRQEVTQ